MADRWVEAAHAPPVRPALELDGTWQASIADDELHRTWLEGDGDGRWTPVTVPGHWRSVPEFAASDGPILYRKDFELAEPGTDRWWLEVDGIFYQGDVWLDGAYVGDTEGYFVPDDFEVTDLVARGGPHRIGIEVTCSPPGDLTAKRALTGVFQHGEHLAPGWNPGGIWRPVRLRPSGPVAVRRLRVLCTEATPERAVLAMTAMLDADAAGVARIRTTVGDHDHELDQPLAAGENTVQWGMTIPSPDLWWPRALGDQPLHELTVTVTPQAAPEPSDRRSVIIGLRSVRLRNWICHVNGERLFLKGANLAPAAAPLGEVPAGNIAHDVMLARDAGLDLLRVHGHIGRPELYAAADATGMLLWQDLPLQWGYHRSVRKEAARQAARAVDLLGHHPSLIVWCGHNEPFGVEGRGPAGEPGGFDRRSLAAQQLPNWNKTVLDRTIKRALRSADGTRPVIAHSGVLPHPPDFDGTDSHLFPGWFQGEVDDLDRLARAVPRLVRFVSEFGAQAVPDDAPYVDPSLWPDVDWDGLARDHGLQPQSFARHVPPDSFPTWESWRDATQQYQAIVVKRIVETLRRLKYRPTGGFAHYFLADSRPAISASVLDHRRTPKRAWDALVDACRPVIVVADHPPFPLVPGQTLAMDVHVVSDLREPVRDVRVSTRATWRPDGDPLEWTWEGEIGADTCVRVGQIRLVVPDPDGAIRELEVDLTLESADHSATNRYQTPLL
ncbi:MAG TPA: hypothetical protein VHA73_16770 [Acidimicrobiales bacterium]|jgi:beta-mannosidase|nr:hypothetical protein [Acidimicrobiales bacterium]